MLGRVAIIGGGISGLAAAHYLERGDAQVDILEGSDRLGGLGTFFEYDGHFFERFYHVMLPTDNHLLALLADLDLAELPYWRASSFALMAGRSIYPLNGPVDLLKFRALPLVDRLRLGITGLYGGMVRRGDRLDEVSVEDWLTRLSGRRAFDAFWRPLLRAKFGDAYTEVPAAWYWSRFRREKATTQETKGYPKGGYHGLTESIGRSLRDRGVTVRLNEPVDALDLDEAGRPTLISGGKSRTYDRVVSTVPMPLLKRMAAGGSVQPVLDAVDPGWDSVGVVNVVLLSERSAIDHYWVATTDDEVPFSGVVETTQVMDRAETGGRHLIYLLQYVHRSDPRFTRSDDETLAEFTASFHEVMPHVSEQDIEARFVFRAPFVEPIYKLGYQKLRPPVRLLDDRIFLATTAQIYPDVTSWNSSVGLAKRVVAEMCSEN